MIRLKTFAISCALPVFAFLCFTRPSFGADCSLNQAVEAFNADNETALNAAVASMPSNCDALTNTMAHRLEALLVLNKVAAKVVEGPKLDEFEDVLTGALSKAGGPWQVFDALGDIARKRHNYPQAYMYTSMH